MCNGIASDPPEKSELGTGLNPYDYRLGLFITDKAIRLTKMVTAENVQNKYSENKFHAKCCNFTYRHVGNRRA